MVKIFSDWYVNLLGRPWKAVPKPPESFNCGELVRYVHKFYLGIDSPAIAVKDAQNRIDCVRAMQPDVFGLLPLDNDKPDTFDVAFIGRRTQLSHCGIVVRTEDGIRILHCPESASGVVLDSCPELAMQGFPIIKYFRHVLKEQRLQERGLFA